MWERRGKQPSRERRVERSESSLGFEAVVDGSAVRETATCTHCVDVVDVVCESEEPAILSKDLSESHRAVLHFLSVSMGTEAPGVVDQESYIVLVDLCANAVREGIHRTHSDVVFRDIPASHTVLSLQHLHMSSLEESFGLYTLPSHQ